MDPKERKAITKFIQAINDKDYAIANKFLAEAVELKLAKRIAKAKNVKPF